MFLLSVLRVKLDIEPSFNWIDRIHGNSAESFWIWVEDPNTNHIYHHEFLAVTKKQVPVCA